MAFSSSHKGEPGASNTVPSNSRTAPNYEREPISAQTSRQAFTDVAFFAAQLTDSSLAPSTRKKGSGHPKGPRPEPFGAFSTRNGRAHLLLGKHQGQARPPTGQHVPGPPPTGGDPTPPQRGPTLERISIESFALVAGLSFRLALEMRAPLPLVRVFALFLALALVFRALPLGSMGFVQKFSQPHLVPKLSILCLEHFAGCSNKLFSGTFST